MKTFLLLAILSYSLLGSEMQLLPLPPEPLPPPPPVDCGSCAKSRENCSSGMPDNTMFCRCDADCVVYGDCCMDQPRCREPVTPTADSAQGLVLQCRSNRIPTSSSRFMPQAFWMASECPEDWLTRESSTEEAVFIEGNCTRGSSSLPPVSDRDTGVVYVNEYCAVCNGVTNIAPWSYRLRCSSKLSTLIEDNSSLTLTQELIQEYCTPTTFVPPAGLPEGAPARECSPHISSCLPQDELAALNTTDLLNQERYNELVQNCIQGPFNLVSLFGGLPYRNQYCAMCNGIPPVFLICYSGNPLSERFIPFSLVLDIHRDGINVRSEVITTTVSVTCPSGEIFDPVSSDCRPSVCPEGYTLNGSACSFRNATTNTTEPFSCPDGLLPAELNDTDYTELGNETVLLNGEVYEVIDYLEGNPVVCLSQYGSFLENMTVLYYSYPTGYFILTNIGCSLSVVGSFLILLTHILFKELRTLPSKILMNLAVAIIVSNLFILIGGPIISSFPGNNRALAWPLFSTCSSWLSLAG